MSSSYDHEIAQAIEEYHSKLREAWDVYVRTQAQANYSYLQACERIDKKYSRIDADEVLP